MKKNILFILVITLLLLPYAVKAECSTDKIKELKKIADNVTAVSQFDEENAKMGFADANIVTVYGLLEGFYATNVGFNVLFSYDKSENGTVSDTVTSDFGTLNVYNNDCPGQILKSIKLDFKKINKYYESEECEDIKDEIDICSRLYNSDNITYSVFANEVKKYKDAKEKGLNNKFNIVNFVKNNLILVMVISVVIIAGLILLITNKIKRNKLD